MERFHGDYTTGSGENQPRLKIDPEFRAKIPAISEDEYNQLEENILEAGEVYDPLVVWDGTIVDGHNRWNILQEHDGLRYHVRDMEFADKWAAFDWMFKNQLGRRNLTDNHRAYLVGKMYEARKKSQGGNRGTERNESGQFTASAQNEHMREDGNRTAFNIANEVGVGRETVKRAEKFAQGVDALRRVSPEAADAVLNQKVNVTKQEVAELRDEPDEMLEVAAEKILTPPEKKERKQSDKPRKTPAEKQDLADIKKIVENMHNPDSVPEMTAELLAGDIEANVGPFIRLLECMVEDNRNVITEDKKHIIQKVFDDAVERIKKVRESI